jgi:hypothetical protein
MNTRDKEHGPEQEGIAERLAAEGRPALAARALRKARERDGAERAERFRAWRAEQETRKLQVRALAESVREAIHVIAGDALTAGESDRVLAQIAALALAARSASLAPPRSRTCPKASET